MFLGITKKEDRDYFEAEKKAGVLFEESELGSIFKIMRALPSGSRLLILSKAPYELAGKIVGKKTYRNVFNIAHIWVHIYSPENNIRRKIVGMRFSHAIAASPVKDSIYVISRVGS